MKKLIFLSSLITTFLVTAEARSVPPKVTLVEAMAFHGVRKQDFATFVAPANANTYTVADLAGMTVAQRTGAAAYALARVGKAYDIQWPIPVAFGPDTYSCVGLTEAAYESQGLDPTTVADETDGIWPFFYPDEQHAGMVDRGALTADKLKLGDMVYRDTNGVDVIPGTWDHVAIVVEIGGAGVGAAPYTYSSGAEVCCDKIDNDEDGVLDQLDGCPQVACSEPSIPALPLRGIILSLLLTAVAFFVVRHRRSRLMSS